MFLVYLFIIKLLARKDIFIYIYIYILFTRSCDLEAFVRHFKTNAIYIEKCFTPRSC